MTDPLSITASIVAILQASSTVIEYLKNVSGGASDRLRILDEVRSLICLLEMLKDRVEDIELQATWGSIIASLGSPGGPLTQFKETLELLARKLGQNGRVKQAVRSLKWPFDKKDVTAILSTLERQKSLFNIAIQLDHVKLSQAIRADIQTLNDGIRNIGLNQKSQEQHTLDFEREQLCSWLSPLNYRIKHADVANQWQEGTGQWLLESSQFQGWLDGTDRILWCPGIPGAGKTVLASTIIDHLNTKFQDPDIGIAFIYFDYKKENEQVIEGLLLTIIKQLVQDQESVPFDVVKMYEDHKRRGTRPRLVECLKILHLVVANFSKVFLVIDALDECKDGDGTRTKFVSELQKMPISTHTLITSRFISDLEQAFSKNLQLEIRARNEDVTIYLEGRMAQESRLRKHIQIEPGLSVEIITAILGKVQGMFLLAQLHIDSLARKQNRKALRLALQTLPQSLDDTYAEAMNRINRQDTDDVDLAKKVLSWICFAKRPLFFTEIQHAIAAEELDDNEDDLADDGIPDDDVLTSVCAGLVAIDKESATIRLVHYTTQDFFYRSRDSIFPNTNATLASTCIRYLSLHEFSSGVCHSDHSLQERFHRFPFFRYAAQHWGNHARNTLDASRTELIVTFLKDYKLTSAAIQGKWVPEHRYSEWSEHYPREVPALVYAAAFGLSSSIQYLFNERIEIDESGSDNQTALIAASRNGHVSVVTELLTRGSNINITDLGGETALAAAAAQGHEIIVAQLIAAKSNINSQASDGWTPLMAAVSNGHRLTVERLLAAGADTNIQSADGESVLTLAIRAGHKDILSLLLTAGSRILAQTSEARTALALARRRGDEDIMKELEAYISGLSSQTPFSRPTLVRDDNRYLHINETGQPVARLTSRPPSTLMDPSTAHSLNLFKSQYVLGGKIGKGHYAEVFICRHRASGLRYCAKVFPSSGDHTLGHNNYEHEFRILSKLRHNNIIVTKDFFTAEDRVYMVIELAPEGELFNFIVMKQKLSEIETRAIFTQIFSAIQYLHNRKIIHRDIKPENILLASGESPIIKLCDFGIAKDLSNEDVDDQGNICSTTLCGTPSYVAPEILEPSNKRRYGFPVDIWSAGVVLYICLCGFPPFSDELYTEENPYTLTRQIKEGRFDYPSPYWDSVGDPALDLIDQMLTVDVGKRIKIDGCLKHQWLNREGRWLASLDEYSEEPEL